MLALGAKVCIQHADGTGGRVTFDQEIHPRIEFSNNPLKVVVAQIKFPAMFGMTEPAALAGFQIDLGHRYPTALPRIPNVTVTVGPAGAAETVTDAGPVRLASDDGMWFISIANDSISLETKAYESWIGFRDRLEELMGAIPDALRPHHTARIGLRFVDQIQASGVATLSDWQPYIDPSLLGSPESLIFDERMILELQQISLRIDESAINLRHGYVQNPPDADFPSTYVIDTDVFTETEQPFDWAAILDRVNQYHDWAWNLFRRSITPAAVRLLGGSDE
jgi:uncharacterized protein (TIGR04255 family)